MMGFVQSRSQEGLIWQEKPLLLFTCFSTESKQNGAAISIHSIFLSVPNPLSPCRAACWFPPVLYAVTVQTCAAFDF